MGKVVVESIRSRRIPTQAGKYDEGVGLNSDDCGCACKSKEDRERGAASIAYTNQIISEENRNYIRLLPKHMQLAFKEGKEEIRLLMVQYTFRYNLERVH